MVAQVITQLLNDHQIWSGSQKKHSDIHTLSTGHAALDHYLSGDGWPLGALIECRAENTGMGELQLFLPVMQRLCLHHEKAMFWVNPPHLPYPPAMVNAGLEPKHFYVVRSADREDYLWTLDQLLRCPAVGLVMGWSNTLGGTAARRLQLAAEGARNLALIMTRESIGTSPAPLRLSLAPDEGRLAVTIKRQRGGAGARVELPLSFEEQL